MTRTTYRALLAIAAPFILLWAFLSTLVKETRMAFRYAWQEVRIEIAAMRRAWNEGPPR